MNRTHIIIGLLIVLVILFIAMNQKSEHLESSNLSNEAIQNIASVYANTAGEAVFNKIKVTGIKTSTLDSDNFKGIIVMWSGTDVPNGWALCDGTNGTPDLRGRFVLGSGKGNNLTQRNLNDKGGSEEHKLTVEELASHTHMWADLPAGNDNGLQTVEYTFKGENQTTTVINQHDNGRYNIVNNVTESETSKTGNNRPHNNMPPFYVLAYIMKI